MTAMAVMMARMSSPVVFGDHVRRHGEQLHPSSTRRFLRQSRMILKRYLSKFPETKWSNVPASPQTSNRIVLIYVRTIPHSCTIDTMNFLFQDGEIRKKWRR
jgi:hypothetical protein